jgi:hypothetical protein
MASSSADRSRGARVGAGLALAAALALACAGCGARQSHGGSGAPGIVSFKQLSTSATDADLRTAIVEIVYLGPAEKLPGTFDVTAGADPVAARAALHQVPGMSIPPVGGPNAFALTPTQLRAVVSAIGDHAGASSTSPSLGFFALVQSTGQSAVLRVDAASAPTVLGAVYAALPAGDARTRLGLLGSAYIGRKLP